MSDAKWDYNGHICEITLDREYDVIKAWHEVTKPDGTKVVADIDPYDRSHRTLEMWIDAQYPTRKQGQNPHGPLERNDLEALLTSPEHIQNAADSIEDPF
jgi:hypothetical protein